MELLQFPLALALYLGGLALTALGAGRRPRPLRPNPLSPVTRPAPCKRKLSI